MSEITLGQVAYEEYHHGPAQKQAERKTVGVLPYAHLTPQARQVWEDIAKAVKRELIPSGNNTGSGWIGVDFDGTLAVYGADHGKLGAPIQSVVDYVLGKLNRGITVKIVTARASPCHDIFGNLTTNRDDRAQIEEWCIRHLGRKLEITCAKDYGMIELIDDRSVQVVSNKGIRADGQSWANN